MKMQRFQQMGLPNPYGQRKQMQKTEELFQN